jgi:superfamily II DNA helicase RecQ
MTAESVAELLQSDGHSAAAYHGGMDAGLRAKTQVTICNTLLIQLAVYYH